MKNIPKSFFMNNMPAAGGKFKTTFSISTIEKSKICMDLDYINKFNNDPEYNIFDQIFTKYSIKNMKIAIINGSEPWVESVAIKNKNDVTIIESINHIFINHKDLKCISYENFLNSDDLYDVIINNKDISKRGLGLYDSLNADADVECVQNIMLKLKDENSLLLLNLEIGNIDHLIFNTHRIYGPIRLIQMTNFYEILENYNLQKELDSVDTLMILRKNTNKLKIFCSGTCRLFNVINNGRNKLIPVHNAYYCVNDPVSNVNFLGKLHNTRQHIQFIKYIKNDIAIPEDILKLFLGLCEDAHKTPVDTVGFLRKNFEKCDVYIFEISSIKLYKKNGFEVTNGNLDDYENSIQTEEDLYNDLNTLCELVPIGKKIIFQVHFRPNFIFNDNSKIIQNRELIYETVKRFCENRQNTKIYDPSIFLRNNPNSFDGDVHFTPNGIAESFEYLYESIKN
jgi:hypothetical protein